MMTVSSRKGYYDWNDQQNALEFVRTGPGRQSHGYNPPSNIAFQSSKPSQKHSPRFGILRHSENALVSLSCVKEVALNLMKQESSKVSTSFVELYSTQQFNNFLVMLLRYFKWFFEELEQKERPNKTSYLQPSRAEVEALAITRKKLSAAKKQLGQTYCILLLGLGLEKQHHMACGKQRVSSTHRDKKMFEDLYDFCFHSVSVTFRRQEMNKIKLEIGNMLRSPFYNPALRPQPTPEELEEANKKIYRPVGKSTKPIGERVEALLAVKLPEVKKLSPAEYKRKYGKRPAMMKAIYQRSSALISLLPLPPEESSYLFKPHHSSTKLLQDKHVEEEEEDTDDHQDSPTMFSIIIDPSEKIGIIGEPLEQFSPDSLMPRNVESEEVLDNRDDDSILDGHEGPGPNTGQRNIHSRATTEDGN